MIITAITGASGSIMGVRFIEELLNRGEEVSAVVSTAARQVIESEIMCNNENYSSLKKLLSMRGVPIQTRCLVEYENDDFSSPIASGTTYYEAVVVIPCSMKTLASISQGYSDSLISRVCDVALKERRRCIIVPRETPMNIIHLENMYKAGLAGVEIVPPVPGFYTHPKSIDDIINFIVGKILNLLGRDHTLFKSWREIRSISDD